MSIIIIRERDAEKIDERVLQSYVETSDAWGITWYDESDHKVHYFRSMDIKDFIDGFRRRERENYKMVVHLNEFWTGTPCRANVQPIRVNNVGLVNIDGYLSDIPEEVEVLFDGTQSEKSEEYMIYEMFQEFCETSPKLGTINKWNIFLKNNEQLLETCRIVMMTLEGYILNNKPEDGEFKNGNKLWFSQYNEPKVAPVVDRLTYEVVVEKLDEWNYMEIEQLHNLSKKQLSYLCEEYPYQVALLISNGNFGFQNDKEEDGDDGDNGYSLLIKDREMIECSDCKTHVFSGIIKTTLDRGHKIQLCPDCFYGNGASTE